jgi:branched-chain amino acid transport system ATP-binding protein
VRETFSVTILLVEHDMQIVMGISDRVHVLDHGELIASGLPKEVQAHPEVLRAYLGEESA